MTDELTLSIMETSCLMLLLLLSGPTYNGRPFSAGGRREKQIKFGIRRNGYIYSGLNRAWPSTRFLVYN